MMPKLSGIKKNNLKNKFICEPDDCNDFLIESNNDKVRMTLKRDIDEIDAVLLDRKGAGDVTLANNQNGEEELFGQLQYKIEDKKRKLDSFTTDCVNKGQKKVKDCMEKQAEVRRKCTDRLMRSFSAILTQLESDGMALADNEQRLQRLMAAQLKSAQQGMTVHAQRLQALKDIQGSYLKSCEAIEKNHREECAALAEEMSRDANHLQQQLVKEIRRSVFENFQKSMLANMHSDI